MESLKAQAFCRDFCSIFLAHFQQFRDSWGDNNCQYSIFFQSEVNQINLMEGFFLMVLCMGFCTDQSCAPNTWVVMVDAMYNLKKNFQVTEGTIEFFAGFPMHLEPCRRANFMRQKSKTKKCTRAPRLCSAEKRSTCFFPCHAWQACMKHD